MFRKSSVAALVALFVLSILAMPAVADTTTTTTQTPSPSSTTVTCPTTSIGIFSRVKCTVSVSGNFPLGVVTWSSNEAGSFSRSKCYLFLGSCSVVYRPSSTDTPVTITANYAGDKHNQPSSGTFSLTVTLKDSDTKATCLPDSVVAGSPTKVTCRAAVSGHRPEGTVTWSQTGGTGSVTFAYTTCTLNYGRCSIKLTGSTVGSVTIQASYGGDTTHLPSTATATLTVKAKTSLALTCIPSPVASGSASTCTATLSGFSGSVSGEGISWYRMGGAGAGTFSSTTCALSPSGSCSITVTGMSAGNIRVGAFYLGDSANSRSSKATPLKVT